MGDVGPSVSGTESPDMSDSAALILIILFFKHDIHRHGILNPEGGGGFTWSLMGNDVSA